MTCSRPGASCSAVLSEELLCSWDRINRHAILTAMRRTGWVASTDEPRSLRPGESFEAMVANDVA